MYEHNSREAILERMLEKIPGDFDKREGSIIYDALSPAAMELSFAYKSLDEVLQETFADTAGRETLIKRAKERGMEPFPAVAAEYTCLANIEIPLGTRFTVGNLYFVTTAGEGSLKYRIKCETAGKIGNDISGNPIPVQYIDGFETIKIIDRPVAGEDAEDTEHFRNRYMKSFQTAAFGGNITDYKNHINALPDVGGCKICPAWDGGGTVKVYLCDKGYKAPSPELVNTVQEIVDPADKTGLGEGIAPIGHRVTICGAVGVTINITTELTLEEDWSLADLRGLIEDEIDGYYLELGTSWQDSEAIVVRISQIETRIVGIPHVIDVKDTLINGARENLILDKYSLPQRGEFNG